MEKTFIFNKKLVIKNDLKFNGVTLLSYKIEYPEFFSSHFWACLSGVNRFYRNKALAYKRYCETKLFRMAVEQYKLSIENGYPIRVYEAMQVYEVTDSRACIVSIYFDRYQYTGGAHGNTIRQSQTWDLQKCGLVALKQLISCPPDYKSYILSEVETQIAENPDIYFENYKELITETFDQNSFYCTLEGIVIYYQQYDIAPYSSGIREFFIPYSRCVTNPQIFCH
ncbi:MAG: DUF3298 and DUF4163 domain-containing protein [Oscillospiraceae bacterium]